MRSILVLGSSGRLGSALTRRLRREGHAIVGADRVPSSTRLERFVQLDLSAESFESLPLSDVDTVVFAVPAPLATRICTGIGQALPPNALVVDLLSEKVPFVEKMKTVRHVSHIGVHLLFSPSLDWTNQNVIVTPRRIPNEKACEWIELLARWGCKVHRADPLEHDRLMGLVQVGVHAAVIAYGVLLRNSAVSFNLLHDVSTPASRILWAMLARIIDNNPSVYWEIQSENSISTSVREEFADALRRITRAVTEADKEWFDDLFEDLGRMMRDHRGEYTDLAQNLYNIRRRNPISMLGPARIPAIHGVDSPGDPSL